MISMFKGPKISVIVPIYNVQDYLFDCLDSICNQTYKNLEIILINDGSTDDSLSIAKTFAEKDKRIILISQENKGLSGARNVGIDIATGEFICFVDSDDLLFGDAIFCLEKFITSTDSDIAIVSNYLLKDDKLIRPILFKSDKVEIYNRDGLMDELAKCEKIQNYAWGKLFKASLFRDIRFPLGRYFEDQFIMMQIFNRANRGVFIDDPKYVYRYNGQSISHNMSDKKLIDYGQGFVEKASFYLAKRPNNASLLFKTATGVLSEIRKKSPIILKRELRHIYVYIKKTIFSKKSNRVSKILCMPIISWLSLIIINKKFNKELIFRIFFRQPLVGLSKKMRLKNKAIIYLGSPEYDNIGDHAIFIASKAFFQEHFPDYDFLSYTESEVASHLSEIIKSLHPLDVVVIQGGGNIGSIYPQESMRRKILKMCSSHNIFVMPSSINFSSDKKGNAEFKKSKKIYDSSENLTLFTRDRFSFEFANNNFKCRVLEYPDIVFYLSNMKKGNLNENANLYPLLCLRDDLESKMSFYDKKTIYDNLLNCVPFFNSDDTSCGYLISTNNSQTEFKKMLDIFDSASFVMTDRLHGMIFSYLLNKKCIVFSNFDKKIEGAFEWIKDSKNIVFVGNKCPSSEQIRTFLIKPSTQENNERLKNAFDNMEQEMRKLINERFN